MLLQFSDTTNKKGLIQALERATGTQSATTASYPLLDKTVDINIALANFFLLATKAEGRFQVDDSNHTDYPVIYFDIVAGQQDYSFTVDQNGNQIMDIYKIRVKDSQGNWHTLKQRDLQGGDDDPLNRTTQTSTPIEYDLTANGIFLTDIPNYSSVQGGEIYINRTGSYFVSTDTTKKAGIPEIFMEYLFIRPAYFWCLINGKPQATGYYRTLYGIDGKGGMEKAIMDYYGKRNRDERPRFTVRNDSNK